MLLENDTKITQRSIMPYSVKKESGSRPYKIVKKTTGKTVGSSTSKEMANRAIRARHAHEMSK